MVELALPKPKKKVSRTYLKRKADTLFAKYIRSIGACEMQPYDSIRCGGSLQCCHIIGRSNMALRYDDKNAICMCQGHHVYYTFHPMEFLEKISRHFKPYWEYLQEKRNQKVKVDYYEVIAKYSDPSPNPGGDSKTKL